MANSFQDLKAAHNNSVEQQAHKKNNIDKNKDPLGWELAQAFLTTKNTQLVKDLVKWANVGGNLPM